MNKYLIGAGAILVILIITGVSMTFNGTEEQRKATGRDEGIKLVVHKSPTCGCCGVWASYMGGQGYSTEVHETSDLRDIKTSLGVPAELESCHTSEVEGYVVEGHIPSEAVEKLLATRPDIKGIGMPDMPSGSPGMPGPKRSNFVIYEIEHTGEKGEVFMTL